MNLNGMLDYVHSYTDRWIPNAFSSRQVGIHMLLGFGFDDLNPFNSVTHQKIITDWQSGL